MAFNVNDVVPRVELTAAASQTIFSFNFLLLEEQDLQVFQDGTLLTNPAQYTINGGSLEDDTGGSVTLVTPATGGESIIIQRDTVITREATFTTGGSFPATTIEREESDQYLIMQELLRQDNRSLVLPTSLTGAVSEWVAPVPVDGRGIYWNGTDGTLANTDFDLNSSLATIAALQPAQQPLYGMVVEQDFSASPIAPAIGFNGVLYRIDTSGGNVVVNLDELANYGLDVRFAFVKITGDANTITINRGGTDTFDAGATSIAVSAQNVLIDIMGDSSAGVWQSRSSVSSVFGRTGEVVAAASDYDASQVDNDSGVTGTFVSNALDTLNTAATGSIDNHSDVDTTTAAPNPGEVLEWDGANFVPAVPPGASLVEGTEYTIAGTENTIDFTGIPTGVKNIIITFKEVLTPVVNDPIIQIGTGGVPTTTGYISVSLGIVNGANPSSVSSVLGFRINADTSLASPHSGHITLTRTDTSGLNWVASHTLYTASDEASVGGGQITLAGELDMIRIAKDGAATFTSGIVNIQYST